MTYRLTSASVAKDGLGLSDQFSIAELHVPPFLVGRSLIDSDLRRRFSINLVTVRRRSGDSRDIIGVPPPGLVFAGSDELVVFGTEKALKDFSNRKEF